MGNGQRAEMPMATARSQPSPSRQGPAGSSSLRTRRAEGSGHDPASKPVALSLCQLQPGHPGASTGQQRCLTGVRAHPSEFSLQPHKLRRGFREPQFSAWNKRTVSCLCCSVGAGKAGVVCLNSEYHSHVPQLSRKLPSGLPF